jgi:phenylacetate-CoA ligase
MTAWHSPLLGMRSDIQAADWPPIPHDRVAALAALLWQLEATQWQPTDEILRHQHRQLAVLAAYAQRHSPHFRARLAAAGLRPDDLATPEGLSRLPVLKRRDIQQAGASLHCAEVPPGHGPVAETRTSGSTGEPLSVMRTSVCRLFWMALTMRDHLWHGRDFTKRLSVIRANIASYKESPSWGRPVDWLFASGRSQGMPIDRDAKRQVEALERFGPESLLTYPNNLDLLARYCEARGSAIPGLRHARTISETLKPEIRRRAEAVLGVLVEDLYSSQEVGIIAVQCPKSELYHVMAESVLVEVLDDGGRPCRPGEVGRLVVTDLHNLGTPLLRYDIADFAEAGGACPCGRGLPTLRRIVGRERNLILMPDGTRHWPLTGMHGFRDVAPISQYQLIQDRRESMELRLVCETPLTRLQESDLVAMVQKALGHPFEIRLAYFPDRLPLGPNGKFEEFSCGL